jgi:deoxyribose-phosphate aldolase
MESTQKINRFIDHTLLAPTATRDQIKTLCEEALKYDFFSVCLNPFYVAYASSLLKGSSVSVCTVIGFPLGANTTDTKIFETKKALADGAHEIDMVLNVGALKNREFDLVYEDIHAVVTAAGDKLVKVILETALLTDDEKKKACELATKANARFVKTSTGFSTGGATIADVKLMKASIPAYMEVKASGGVRNLAAALDFIDAGATRLGTSSGVAIMNGLNAKEGSY